MLQAKLSQLSASHCKAYCSPGDRAKGSREHLFALWLLLSAEERGLNWAGTLGGCTNPSSSPTCEGYSMCKTSQWTRWGWCQMNRERMKQTILREDCSFESKRLSILMARYEISLYFCKSQKQMASCVRIQLSDVNQQLWPLNKSVQGLWKLPPHTHAVCY